MFASPYTDPLQPVAEDAEFVALLVAALVALLVALLVAALDAAFVETVEVEVEVEEVEVDVEVDVEVEEVDVEAEVLGMPKSAFDLFTRVLKCNMGFATKAMVVGSVGIVAGVVVCA